MENLNHTIEGDTSSLSERRAQLRNEYIQVLKSDTSVESPSELLDKYMGAILLDMIRREKDGQFVGEDSHGAQFWGGHYYLQTASEVTGLDMDAIWKAAIPLMHDKKIQLEGMVVQEYTTPPEPNWDEVERVTFGDIEIAAAVPAHSRMHQNWRYTVYDTEGHILVRSLPGSVLYHDSTFGIDIEDIDTARREMSELAELVKRKRDEGYLTKREMIERDAAGDTDVK